MRTQLPFVTAISGIFAMVALGSMGSLGPMPKPIPAHLQATAIVVFGQDTVFAQVAATPSERSLGLKNTSELPDNEGMLFVFDRESVQSFWMENTPIDLDIAFLDAALRVVDIQQMEALSLTIHDSRQSALYALEVRSGWFAEKGIRVGTVAKLEIRP